MDPFIYIFQIVFIYPENSCPKGFKYAVHLITTHFDDLVAKVCEFLLQKRPLTLQAIVWFTELTTSQVKNSLLVLIHHNCVQAFILEQHVVHVGDHGDGAKLDTQYIALFNNLIHRWRFPKFLTFVSQKLDKQCVELLEALLLHGRLTLKQMSDRAKSGQNEGDDVIVDAVREAFIKLLNTHFVEQCPAYEPVLKKPTEEEASASEILEEKETLEQCVLEVAAPSETLRFLLVAQTEPASDGGKDESSSSSMTPGEKRNCDASESDTQCGATDEQVVLWRTNFEEFIRCLRHKVESIVLKRYGRDAYRIFRLLLNTSRLLETDKIPHLLKKILYKLWKDDYLHIEKLQLIGVRQSQFLLWKVNKNTLQEHVLDEMFYAALTLSQ